MTIKERPLSNPSRRKGKPLEMLKTLIAFGGRDISEDHLCTVLWPDSEGDAAHRSFDTTLHRLRKLIEHDKALTLDDGRLSLNSELCWVDAWTFERLQGKLESIFDQAPESEIDANEIGRLSELTLSLYSGHFLKLNIEQPWTLAYRERLRSKFMRLVRKTGLYWEQTQDWNRAIDCYQRGLEIDNLVEEFYQRLMICNWKLGLHAEALVVYQRCQNTLRTLLCIEPSEKTQTIYRELVSKG
jgi:two-component SAPR family response regulator